MAFIRASLPLISLRPFPLASVILITIFLAVSLVIIGFRTYVRYRDNAFGLDDAFILAGTVLYIVSTALGTHGLLSGNGDSGSSLDTGHRAESFRYFYIWTMVYALTLALVISSIRLVAQTPSLFLPR
ncbi:hypothetical protein N0V93_001926 [Gnomoniopsis smithogilvyi]|uniref:Uncharacterized protein n=1 Tax=Gnomoniopsis smithogilvyi TaxID=1191159 RepID=A0A9W8Z6V6_9PEZI|nr:hypothetical protein N0V93_001926 [Gnomoniopsis smithogilvyi]